MRTLVASHLDEFAEALETWSAREGAGHALHLCAGVRNPSYGGYTELLEMLEMPERGAPALRAPDPGGVNRWILRAKRLNSEVLDSPPCSKLKGIKTRKAVIA